MGIPTGNTLLASYNPVTHTGPPGAAAAEIAVKKPGNRFASATAAQSNLHGSACIPKHDAAASDNKANSSRPSAIMQLPARVDHLSGTACIPSSSRSLSGAGGSSDGGSNSSMSDHSKHTAAKAKMLTLRAAVDHLSGEGCTVRQVDVVATLDAPPPTVARGMATRLVRDRQIARAAHEHNMSSCLYKPGQGYTKVVLAGQDKATPQGPSA